MSGFKKLTIGVLALQGDFENHCQQIANLGAKYKEVKTEQQLDQIDGLIIPGGESTTMDILLDRFELRDPIVAFASTKPIWGTCAGMIMVAKKIEDNQSEVQPFGLIDIDVIRNGYGRQVFSFEENVEAKLGNELQTLTAAFIRAPKIIRTGKGVEVLATFENSPVLVCEGLVMASSFHTELDRDTRLTEYFIRRFLLGL